MAQTVVITGRIKAELVERLDILADRVGVSRSAVLANAVEAYIEEQTAFLDFVDEGERDIDEGRYYTLEQMDAWFAERIAALEADASRAKAA